MGFVDINLQVAWHHLILLAIAYVLALPVAMDREHQARSAGLRTFPLVAVAVCGYILVGTSVFADEEAQARILAGLITGMGFIGGGAILKSNGSVSGTATAASLWNTGAIGIAVAYGRFEIAVLLTVINFITLRYVSRFKSQTDPT
jgi:putative Mg2+ transporter-C (MgtC) family protein